MENFFEKKLFYLIPIICITLILIIFFYQKTTDTIEPEKFTATWESKKLNYKKLHNFSTGENQKIAIIDSGVAQDQSTNLIDNINLSNSSQRFDENGHGTMMYSLIKGSEKRVGICPGCEILVIKIMNNDESINPNTIVKALDIAIKKNVDIINFSLGSYNQNKMVKKALEKAIKKNIVIVASAGDYGTSETLFPSNMEKVISVGAIDKNDVIWKNSNAKNKVDINAPGVDVTVRDTNNDEFTSSGTSQATAIISGYIALLKEQQTNISIEQIKSILNKISEKEIDYIEPFKK
ncbi:S8 family peptidase [Viridibacillus sp. NPDC096237]|uniref:S8 family peptidase n=1 Tax=Viridibacillus sp. NPDC096237 TaxID=3390721 RepID=UPI003D008352